MGEWRVSQVRRGWVMGKVDDWDWELLYGFSNAKRRSCIASIDQAFFTLRSA